MLHHPLKAAHTLKTTEHAVNKCSTDSSTSSQKGHITELMAMFLLLKFILVGSLYRFPLQFMMLHFIGTHLHQTKFVGWQLPLSSIIANLTVFTEKPFLLSPLQYQASFSLEKFNKLSVSQHSFNSLSSSSDSGCLDHCQSTYLKNYRVKEPFRYQAFA
ncbi:hypothetical protein Hdeb2414_s0019g00542331 [Helianthus debilis subsp. tardiflorus]